ncbi:MAG: hypothetical protein K2W95_10590 [Candidatus Obscuribacterales bacterium]|nr:hypothetical protein [Candidatus Obscuribacterales bacterium]
MRSMMEPLPARVHQVELPLADAVMQSLEEARMVPGTQALFGFQFMAVFNQPFESLTAKSRLFIMLLVALRACR